MKPFFRRKLIKRLVILALAFGSLWMTLYSHTTVSTHVTFPLLQTVYAHASTEFFKDTEGLSKALEYGAIRGLLESLEDPYTRFLDPKRYTEMRSRMNGQFTGVGVGIGIKKGQVVVIAPLAGSPAEKAGLRAMDMIMSIDGHSTYGLTLEEASSYIRGKKGTVVSLKIMRGVSGNILDMKLVRSKIKMHAVSKVMVFGKIGYIRLTTFENYRATQEMEAAIRQLKKQSIEGLLLDVRNNGGGLLNNAVSISGMFIAKGNIVHKVDRYQHLQTERVSGTPLYTGPLMVLVNQGSASASEILAGALKDHHRAIIVGQRSFGKASVQKVIELEDGSAVLLTVAQYLTPLGIDISKKGLGVDHMIPDSAPLNEDLYTVQTDRQLQDALALAKKEWHLW